MWSVMWIVITLAMAMFWTVLFEFSKKPWMSVLAWICWWAMSASAFAEGQWALSLLPFFVGLLYFFRMLFAVVEPKKLRRMMTEV